VYTVNRGNFGENCPKGRLITSMFGYLLPVTSTSTVKTFAIRRLRKWWYSKNFGYSPSRLGCKSRDSETKFLEMDEYVPNMV